MEKEKIIYRVTITANGRSIPKGIHEFATKEKADEFMEVNIDNCGGVKKEIYDIFSKKIICNYGFEIVGQKIIKQKSRD